MRNRLAVALNWLWIYATGDRSARLITQGDQRHARATGPASWSVRRRRRSLPCAERLGSGDSNARLPQQGQSSFTYVLDGKAIFMHHDVAWSRRTEAVYAQDVTAIADVAMPPLRGTRLDGKSCMD